ncbi:MAG: BMP family protein [Elainellaceae cyanobacterium]
MAMMFNRRKFIVYSSAALGTSLFLKACTTGQSSSPDTDGEAASGDPESTPYRVAAVFSGVVTDGGWNQSAYEGLNAAKDRLGFEFSYVEQIPVPDHAEALSEFARQGFDLVLGHSGDFVGSAQQVAGQFPDTQFLVTNGNISSPNISSVQTNNLQAGYLAGTAAGLVTESNKIAFVVAKQFKAMDQLLRGFELGAKAANPAAEVAASYTGDWDDVAKGKEATAALISAGADVVYSYLDSAYVGSLEAVKEKGVYLIGHTSDRLDTAPDHIITSVVQNVGMAIASVVEIAQNGNLEPKNYVVGAENSDVLHVGRFGEAIPSEVQQTVGDVEEQLQAGDLVFEDCQVDGAESWCIQDGAAA